MFNNENNTPKDIFGVPKSNSQTNHSKGADPAGQFLNELIHYSCLVYFWGISAYVRQLFTAFFYLPISLAIVSWFGSSYISKKNLATERPYTSFYFIEFITKTEHWTL